MKKRMTILFALHALLLSAALLSPAVNAEDAGPADLDKEKKAELTALVDEYFETADTKSALRVMNKIRRLEPISKKDYKFFSKYVWDKVKALPKPDKARGTIEVSSPYGKTKVIITGKADKKGGLLLGLHGGGPDSGDGSEAAGSFSAMKDCLGVYPTAINKIWNAWNDPPQERFLIWLLKYIRRFNPYDTNKVYVAGHSMGGHGAYGALLQYADIFAGGVPSAGNPLVEDATDKYGDALKLADSLYHNRVWIAHCKVDEKVAFGPAERWVEAMKKLHEAYPSGYDYKASIYEENGAQGHGLPKEGVHTLLNWVAEKPRDPRPKLLRWRTYREWKQHYYWLFVDQPQKLNFIEAEYTAPDTVSVKSDDIAGRVSVLFNEKLVNIDKPVKVIANGKEVFNGMLKYSVSALVASVKEYEDTEFEYCSRVDLELP